MLALLFVRLSITAFTMYYFAYGSNMDAGQMRERCPRARLLGPALLEGYRLGFTIYSPLRKCGCADVLVAEGKSVYGLLYKLDADELENMDRFEGHPVHYRRTGVTICYGDIEIPAYTYEVVNKKDFIPTSDAYLNLLRNAAALHGFPIAYQEYLATFGENSVTS